MAWPPLHYTGLLPLAAAVAAGSAGLIAIRELSPRLYRLAVVASVATVALMAGALASLGGADLACAALAVALALASAAFSTLYRGSSAKLLRLAALLAVVGWLVYWVPFATLDYSLHEVYWSTSPGLPLWMRLASAWSGSGGSLYLFTTIASLGLLYLLRGGVERRSGLTASLAAVLVLGLASAALNNAFTLLPWRPASGAGLNPLLKSPWLYPHPLTTFGGYALLVVSLLGLLAGAGRSRCWALYEVGWAMLTTGILLGGYWSYETFGWGGYWAWDPVETSELMVWLAATLVPHLVSIAPRLQGFAASMALSSVFLAMYVARTGLSPLHSFAAPGLGALLLLAASLASLAYSLYLLGEAVPRRLVGRLGGLTPERAGMLVASSALMAAALFVYATLLTPSLLTAFGVKVSVPQMEAGVRYYHPVLYPLLLAMLAALPPALLGDRLGWRGCVALLASVAVVSAGLGAAALKGSLVVAPLSPATTNAMVVAGIPWASAAAASAAARLVLEARRGVRALLLSRAAPVSILHLGLALTVIGVLLSGPYSFSEAYSWKATLKPGAPVALPGGVEVELTGYSFGLGGGYVDVYTGYVGRSATYFWAWRGLKALAEDLARLVTLYEKGAEEYHSNETVSLLANLSAESPFELGGELKAEAGLRISLFSFEGGSAVTLYEGPALIELRDPRLQVSFSVDPRSLKASVEAALLADSLKLEVKGNATLPEERVGVHEVLVLEFRSPLALRLPNATLYASRAVVYSSALLEPGRGEPIRVHERIVEGARALLYLEGRLSAQGLEVKVPAELPRGVAVYVLSLRSPELQKLFSSLRGSSLYGLLMEPERVAGLARSPGVVDAPKAVPESAWLELTLRIGVAGASREVSVKVRFDAYGEVQGIHGLVPVVLHPGVGLDEVYVVVSPPAAPGVLGATDYHELMLYYLHEVFRELPAEKRLALAAIMASGYTLDVLKRLGPEQAVGVLERTIVDLYLAAEKYDPSNSTIASEGVHVQVKVVPCVRLVWAGPLVMAFSALYAAATTVRRGDAAPS